MVQGTEPSISIVIPSFNARGTIARCLGSLRGQETQQPFEVVVVDSSTDGTADLVAQMFPEVLLLRSENRLFAGDARNRGIAASRGSVIAFVDADCTMHSDWIEGVLAAHAAGHLVVASAIENGSPESLAGWTYYFCEFNLWMPARRPRMIAEAAGCCLSLRRSVFEQYGPFLAGTYCSDTAFHWKLQADGQGVYFAPDIHVHHHTSDSLLGLVRHVYAHRSYFARVKCAQKDLSSSRRLLELLLLPATPGLLMGAVLLRLRRCPSYIPVFVATSPAVFLSFVARALGEAAGYLGAQAGD